MTAPISLIPSEIWSKIFVFAVADESLKVGIDNPRIILTHVSSFWRTVALQTSELWSDIRIYASSWCPESTIIKNGSMAKLWLERTGTSIPISLELEDYSYSWDAHANLISPYAPRLRKLKISGYLRKLLAGHNSTIPVKSATENVTVMVKTAMSSVELSALEELVIVDYTVDRRNGRPQNQAEALDFHAPRLKRLVVSIQYPFTFSERIFPSRNNHLTHIYLSTEISYNQWRYILKKCSPILECGAFWIHYYEPNGMYEEVVLKKLTHLSLSARQRLNEPLLHGIVCPSLQSFYANLSTRYIDRDFLRIIAPVRRLCINFISSWQENSIWMMIVMAAPLLSVLIVIDPPNYKAMFDALMPNEIHDVLPRLTSLVVFGRSSDKIPVNRCIEFLDSRWSDRPLLSEADGTTCRLTDVQIHSKRELKIKGDARLALENFRKEGLRVVLRSDSEFLLTWPDWLQLELEQMDWAKGVRVNSINYADDLRKAMMQEQWYGNAM